MADNDKKTADGITEAAKDPVKKDKRTVDVVLKADYWDSEGERISKGTTIKLDIAAARILLEENKAERSLEDL